MNSSNLTPEQYGTISKSLFPSVNYLRRLQIRLDETGFPSDDPLRIRVERTINALHDLKVWVHYRACGDTSQ